MIQRSRQALGFEEVARQKVIRQEQQRIIQEGMDSIVKGGARGFGQGAVTLLRERRDHLGFLVPHICRMAINFKQKGLGN